MQKNHKNSPGNRKSFKPDTILIVDEPTELMDFLITKLTQQGRNNIKSLLSHRQVIVNDQVVTQFNHPLNPGEKVIIKWSLIRDKGNAHHINILYEDQDVIVIDKPAGLLSIASDKEKELTAYRILMDHVRNNNPEDRIFIVHRLDRDTSGVMLFAKNETCKLRLQDNWKDMVSDRAYVAVVEGQVKVKHGTIKSWLKETKTRLVYSSGKPGDGQLAVTNYKVLKNSPRFSLLEIRLETGRKNQIRVHMQDIGHSIVGDKKYGASGNPIGRLALHAHKLSFRHPGTDELMTFETEIPKKFKHLVNR